MATQITASLPTLNFPKEVDYPTQEDWPAFSAAAESNFGILGGSWSTQMQLWKDQANAMSIELNNNADIAQSVANYQGDWISQGYTLGQSVSVGGIYYVCKLTHATGQNPTDIGSLYWNLVIGNWNLKADKTEAELKVDKDMSAYATKTTPIDADLLPLSDSNSSFGIKKLTWANIKATLKTYFDTLYATPAYVDGKMVLGTAVSSTSGTSIDFTGIPSWVKRITIMFNGVSTNGTSAKLIQVGSTTITTTGYNSASDFIEDNSVGVASTSGLLIANPNVATDTISGKYEINLISSNRFVGNGILNSTASAGGLYASAGITPVLGGALDRIRITTNNGTDSFDAGQINIMYEG